MPDFFHGVKVDYAAVLYGIADIEESAFGENFLADEVSHLSMAISREGNFEWPMIVGTISRGASSPAFPIRTLSVPLSITIVEIEDLFLEFIIFSIDFINRKVC